MKRIIRACLAAAIIAAMVLALPLGCFADSSVTYTGNSGDFVFAPGSNESPTDLFGNFKNVMPGDVLTQQIVIKNDADKNVDVEIFLKSLGADAASRDLLEKMSLTVRIVDGKELSSGNTAEAAGLAEFVSLGQFASGSTTTLEVTLKVPADLSNEYASSLGKLMWQFKVEEKPVEVPIETGDNSNAVIYIIAGAAAVAVLLVLFLLKRKKRA